MDIHTSVDGTSATLALVGNLTVAAAPGLEKAFSELPSDVTDVTLDLEELEYVASAGLRVIVSNEKRLRAAGGQMRLAHPNEEVMEVLDATGLVDILNIAQ